MTWKSIPSLNDRYEINEVGELRNVSNRKMYKITEDKEGYIRYYFTINRKSFAKYAHRLVAEVFLPNPDSLPVVHHKNNIRSDNRVENLEWVTQKYNRANAFIHCPCCGEKIKV